MGKVKFDPKKARNTFIRAWREHRRLTLEQVAERMAVTPGALSQLENKKVAYTQQMLEGLAGILLCEPQDLISRPPGADEALTTVWSQVPLADRPRALDILKAFTKQP